MTWNADAMVSVGVVILMLGTGTLLGIGPRPWMSAYLERRRLARKAKTYGIDYIPGENLDGLRARLIQERDARAKTAKDKAEARDKAR